VRSDIVDSSTIIGFFLCLGAFFDRFITPSHRLALEKLISREASAKTAFADTFLDYIRAIKGAIFGRFFTGSFFSVRYFTSCAILSLTSLFLIFAAQVFFFGWGDISSLEYSREQIAVIFACVAANIIIDWLSIGQTHAFFSIASEQDRAWRVVLLIISDFYVTINLFMAVFSIVAALMLVLPTNAVETNLRAKVMVFDFPPDFEEKEPWITTAKQLKSPKNMLFFIDPVSETKEKNLTEEANDKNVDLQFTSRTTLIGLVADDPSINLADIIQALFASNEVQLLDVQTIVKVHDGEKTKDIVSARGSNNWQKLRRGANEDIDSARLRVSGRQLLDLSGSSLNDAYSAAFRSVAEVQLSFPDFEFTLPPRFLPLSEVEAFHQALLMLTNTPVFACKAGNTWKHSYSSDLFSQNCDKKIVFPDAPLSKLKSTIKDISNSTLRVPLNTFFLTSFSMTGLIYALLLFLVIARLMWRFLTRFISPYQKLFLKSPFAWTGLSIGIVIVMVILV
jgi:hypothetical protein